MFGFKTLDLNLRDYDNIEYQIGYNYLKDKSIVTIPYMVKKYSNTRYFLVEFYNNYYEIVKEINAETFWSEKFILQWLKCCQDTFTDKEIQKIVTEAAYYGHNTILLYFIQHGEQMYKDLALCNACRNGHVNSIELLLNNGADIHAFQNQSYKNAIRNNHVDCIKLLLKKGASFK